MFSRPPPSLPYARLTARITTPDPCCGIRGADGVYISAVITLKMDSLSGTNSSRLSPTVY